MSDGTVKIVDLNEVANSENYRGKKNPTDATPSNFLHAHWVECKINGIYVNYSNLTANGGDKLTYNAETALWEKSDGNPNLGVLNGDLDADGFKIPNLGYGSDASDSINIGQANLLTRPYLHETTFLPANYTETAKKAIRALEGVELLAGSAILSNVFKINLIGSKNPPLGAGYEYSVRLTDVTKGTSWTVQGDGISTIERLNIVRDYGSGDNFNFTVLIDWSKLEDDFQLWGNGQIYITPNISSNPIYNNDDLIIKTFLKFYYNYWNYYGKVTVRTTTPAATQFHCYLSIEDGLVLGVSGVNAGDFLVGNGATFDKVTINTSLLFTVWQNHVNANSKNINLLAPAVLDTDAPNYYQVNFARAISAGFLVFPTPSGIRTQYHTIIKVVRKIIFTPPTGYEDLRWALAILTFDLESGYGTANTITIGLQGYDGETMEKAETYNFLYTALPDYHEAKEDFGDGSRLYCQLDIVNNDSGSDILMFSGGSQLNVQVVDTDNELLALMMGDTYPDYDYLIKPFVSDIGISTPSFYTDTAKQAINAIQGFEAFSTNGLAETDDISINLIGAANPPLGPGYAYAFQFYNHTRSTSHNFSVSGTGKNKIETLSGYIVTNGDTLKINIVINWSALPDTFQLWSNGSVHFNINKHSESVAFNLVKHNLSNNNICWYGTSIPASGEYPIITAKNLEAVLYNEALGASWAKIQADPLTTASWVGSWWLLTSLGHTITEKQYCIDNYSTIYSQLTPHDAYPVPTIAEMAANDVVPGSGSMGIQDFVRSRSYENLILNKYIDELDADFIAKADILIWDHGFNDSVESTGCYDYIKLLNTRDSSEPGYAAAVARSRDRLDFITVTNAIFDKIFEINPFIRIVIVSHYSRYNHDTLVDTQMELAKYWGMPFINIADNVMVGDQVVVGSSALWLIEPWLTYAGSGDMTQLQIMCPDGVHPHSDFEEHRLDKMIAGVLTEGLKSIRSYT